MKAIAVELDVTDPASVARMAENLRERCGHIHILVNNAGASFGVPADILSYDEAAWIRTVDVCLFSVFRVSRAILPLMLGEPGAIVNTASRAGKVPPLFNSAYAAAKAGVIMLTKTMARELAPHGIRVNAICPGQIRTDLEQWRFGLEASFFGSTVADREQEMCKTIPLGRIGIPEDAGRLGRLSRLGGIPLHHGSGDQPRRGPVHGIVMGYWRWHLCRAAGHFSTLRVLAALPENQLAPDGAQTSFPAVAPLRRQGTPKNLQCGPSERPSIIERCRSFMEVKWNR